MWGEDRDPWEDRVATPDEAVREWAWNAGQDRLNDQWMLHDWDVWVRNPHYTGPDQGHPEDAEREWHDTHFDDGTPTSVYDDGNWGKDRKVEPTPRRREDLSVYDDGNWKRRR